MFLPGEILMEGEEFLVAKLFLESVRDFPSGHIQGREQRGGAMAGVVFQVAQIHR